MTTGIESHQRQVDSSQPILDEAAGTETLEQQAREKPRHEEKRRHAENVHDVKEHAH